MKNKDIFISVFCIIVIVFSAVILTGNVLGVNLTNALNMGGRIITNMGTPLGPSDAATRGYVDSARKVVLQNVGSNAEEAALNPVVGQMWIRTDQ